MKEPKATKLFLDDVRSPDQAFSYTKNSIYLAEGWVVVKNYNEFVDWITLNGVPDLISFDHDLSDVNVIENSNLIIGSDWGKEKTGYDCAKWLVNYCINNKKYLPDYLVHSMNPVGKQNIINLLDKGLKLK